MFALIVWIDYGSKSVVETSALFPEKEEGEITSVKYRDGKLYLAKIVRKSDDHEYLSCLSVTTNGEILTKCKTRINKLVNEEKKCLKEKSKLTRKTKNKEKNAESAKIAKLREVFDSNSDKEELENDIDIESDDELFSGIEKYNQAANEYKQNHPKHYRSLLGDVPKPSTSSINNSNNVEVEDGNSQHQNIMDVEESVASYKKTQTSIQTSNLLSSNDAIDEALSNDSDNPLKKCREAGNGRVQLCNSFNVWIDQSELTCIYRWKSNPKEMTRRLMKILIGENNLKNMCARGKSKSRRAIPADIMNCVEYYVNKKCPAGITPANFTVVVNFMCCSLRNPKKN